MALSNWDTLAINEKGESTNGVFTSPLGVSVEFYKNWLYVRDEKGWQDGGAYIEPTVMEVMSGDLVYKDVHIVAKRGPKNGIYAVIWFHKYAKKKEDEKFGALVGVGCCGYSDSGEWVGIEKTEVDFLRAMLDEHMVEDLRDMMPDSMKGGLSEEQAMHTYYTFDEKIRCINLEGGLRFNQGDAYFATHIGTEIPATEPGEAEPTMMSHIIDNMKKEATDEKSEEGGSDEDNSLKP